MHISELKLLKATGPWFKKTFTWVIVPLNVCHTLSEQSTDPVTKYCESGEKTATLIWSVCDNLGATTKLFSVFHNCRLQIKTIFSCWNSKAFLIIHAVEMPVLWDLVWPDNFFLLPVNSGHRYQFVRLLPKKYFHSPIMYPYSSFTALQCTLALQSYKSTAYLL